jgi:two-component system sensor histidine kinase MprB
LTLRSRFVAATAFAVAVSIAAASLLAWILASGSLRSQVDDTLSSGMPPANDVVMVGLRTHPEIICSSRVASSAVTQFQEVVGFPQVVRADGSTCSPPTYPVIKTTAEDQAVAKGLRGRLYRDGHDEDRRHFRLVVEPITEGYALIRARDLTEIDTSLDRLGLALAATSGSGLLIAVISGLLIARTALKPVNELTRAAEHIADTASVDVDAIPARGHDELARLARAFNRMTSALSVSRHRQQRLIADAGHELRTPLTSMRTNIELLARGQRLGRQLPPHEYRRLLDSVTSQLGELNDLIGELTVLAADKHGTEAVCDLEEVARRAIERAANRGGHSIRADLRPWRMRGDAAALERAVLNVLDNAIKFSPIGSLIDVTLRSGLLTVRDRGPGIDVEDREYVWDRFWRSPASRGLPGSGLGLSIVADTVARHGGEVSIGDGPGGGALVTMRLPGYDGDGTDPVVANSDRRA